MSAILRSRSVRWAFSLLVVVVIFGFFFPKVADYGAVWETITAMTTLEIVPLLAVATWNIVSYWPMLTAVQPGLRLREAAVANLASTAVANTVPGGGALGIGVTMTMQRSWGIPVPETALAMVVSGVWNNFVKLGLPVIALALLALSGGASTALAVAAIAGLVVLAVAISLFVLLLRSEQMAARVGRGLGRVVSAVRRIAHRDAVERWGERAVGFRGDIVGLLHRHWIRITVTSLISHVSLYAVLLVALRDVGVSNDEVSWQQVLAAFAFVRLLSAVPITPGGLGLVELGLTTALGSGLPTRDQGPDRGRGAAVPGLDVAAPGAARRRVLDLLAQQPELAVHARATPRVARVPRHRHRHRRDGDGDGDADDVTVSAMFERRRHALFAGAALLGVAATLTVLVLADRTGSRLQATDDRWLAAMRGHRTPWATALARLLSVLGGPLVMVPLRLLVIGALAWRRRWLQVGAFIGAVVTSELCIGPLKALVDRPWPPGQLSATTSPSFPSGHAIAASVTAIGLVVVLVPVAGSRRTAWTAGAAGFALVMALSRTYLAVHWLSDVVAGTTIGTGLALVWPAALELERERRRNTTRRDEWCAWRRRAAIGLLVTGARPPCSRCTCSAPISHRAATASANMRSGRTGR